MIAIAFSYRIIQ